jgi:DNA-binding NtrC family response regulator
VCTSVGSITEARDNATSKFFPAALVDIDIEQPGAGLDLVRFIQERSPKTSVILLTSRRSFEAAVDALRLGVMDVLVKRPDTIEQLKAQVGLACDRFRATDGSTPILKDVSAVLDEAFHILLVMARTEYHDISVAAEAKFRPRVLVVESDSDTIQELAGLVQGKVWEIGAEMSGGAALDKTSNQAFDVVAVRDELMDFKGTMVLKSIQANRPETVGLLYTAPGPEGRVERYTEGRSVDIERPFRGAQHLVERISSAVQEVGTTQRDRRIIQAFRGDHPEFFRKYAELKLRIDKLLG